MKDERKEDFFSFSLDVSVKRKPYSPPTKKDTSTVRITLGESTSEKEGFALPKRDGSAPREKSIRTANYASHGASFDKRSPASRATDTPRGELLRDYAGYLHVSHVSVRSWPDSYNFYEKFVRDALSSHAARGKPAPAAPFFSYIPQYSQMNAAAKAYYLYIKEKLREGARLPDVDFSYLLLYVYEIINLDGVISSETGAELLSRLWVLYRPMHPTLDKYLCEWLPDYCLTNQISVPDTLVKILADVGAKSSLKEFYADEMLKKGLPLGRLVRLSLSDYNPRNSRYVEKIDGFAAEVEELFDAVIAEQQQSGTGIFDPTLRRNTKHTRDAFCGSLCASCVKKKISLELSSFFRSPEVRRTVSELMKGCENIVRARHGIKARLQTPVVSGRTALLSAKTHEEAEYLALYDAPQEDFTVELASRIEEHSWQNAALLAGESEEEFFEPEVPGAVSGGDEDLSDVERGSCGQDLPAEDTTEQSEEAYDSFSSALRAQSALYDALKHAADGGSFASRCRELALFAPDAAERINALAAEYIGDVVLEPDGLDYTFVSDYKDEL